MFESVEHFKDTLQKYAEQVGFVFVTMRNGSVGNPPSRGKRKVILGCKSAGAPRPRALAPAKKRRKAVESTKKGCDCLIIGKVSVFVCCDFFLFVIFGFFFLKGKNNFLFGNLSCIV